ncbi:MAG: sugar transferase, partial [Thermodesulfobacteriota bacterium]|nr:sugar transferase [Thermodesulfobacteriota bacterium]
WLLQQEGMQGYVSKPYVYMKRLLDLCMAGSLLLLFFPVGLLVSLAIKFDSKGPVIFLQERVGLHGKPFNCLKFRTMILEAEQKSGPIWSTENDIRITRIGKFLRRSRLDELPQLWNIIKGELSFVGPRPIRKHFVDKMSSQIPFYDIRFSVQPGLSGWAQAHNIYAVPDGAGALEYELFYIQNMSFFLDMFTILKTARSVFQAQGK